MKKLTKQEINDILLKNGRKIVLTGEYKNAATQTSFTCDHGHSWLALWSNINSGTGCPVCAIERKRNSSELFNEWLKSDGRGIRLIGEYVRNKTKAEFECSDGHTWYARPDAIKNGRGCPVCNTQTTVGFRKLIENQHRDIEFIGEYLGMNIKTTFRCNLGHVWSALPYNVQRGTNCPECAIYGFNPNEPAWEYVLDFTDFIKFGITNDLPRRLSEHSNNGPFKLVHERFHTIGQKALDWENGIKKTYGGKYVTKDRFPNGYTETLPPNLLEYLIN